MMTPFDRSLLPAARFEFVVLSDTHYMLDPGERPTEFASRRKQTARAEVALQVVKALEPALVIHLGDLVQEYPDTPCFEQAMQQARAQIARVGLQPRLVPGNHDVGDKPDPTMPTAAVTAQSLAWFHQHLGPSWGSFDQGGCHFVLLNTQIMNGDLPEAAQQRAWLEKDLADHARQRIFLFLHLPPYLWDASEADLGHYENLGQPDRSWLLDLVSQHRVELMVAGHVHTSFFDHLGETRYVIANSTSFTRPGFCHLFTSPPPPDRGRDDAAKLGVYLFRVLDDRTDIHFIRTSGASQLAEVLPAREQRLLTRPPAGFTHAHVGISLRQALTPTGEVPLAWPGVIREPIRNDYPLLALLEMGITWVRTQWTDLDDPLQSQRLKILRKEGVRVTATSLWSTRSPVSPLLHRLAGEVDAWEVQITGSPWPSEECLFDLQQCSAIPVPLSLSPVLPGEIIPGKQHPRTRLGYRTDELVPLSQRLTRAGVHLARVACLVAAGQSPWQVIHDLAALGNLPAIGSLDVLVSLASCDAENSMRVAEALLASLLLPGSRVSFDPLITLDRTMDTSNGLLDTLCNPNPAFHVVRCLNSILAPLREVPTCWETGTPAEGVYVLGDGQRVLTLLSPGAGACVEDINGDGEMRVYRLTEGTVRMGTREQVHAWVEEEGRGVVLVVAAG